MVIPIVIITCKKYHGTDYACIQYNRLYTLKSIYSNFPLTLSLIRLLTSSNI